MNFIKYYSLDIERQVVIMRPTLKLLFVTASRNRLFSFQAAPAPDGTKIRANMRLRCVFLWNVSAKHDHIHVVKSPVNVKRLHELSE